jgi:hypothetical protein
MLKIVFVFVISCLVWFPMLEAATPGDIRMPAKEKDQENIKKNITYPILDPKAAMGRSLRHSLSLENSKERLNFSDRSLRRRIRARLRRSKLFQPKESYVRNAIPESIQETNKRFKRKQIISENKHFKSFKE